MEEGTPFQADQALKGQRENLKGRIRSLMDTYDVQVAICDITREQVGLANDDFFAGVDFVPSGVVEVVRLQQKGFADIKNE